jgi:CHAD domain-containing protein
VAQQVDQRLERLAREISSCRKSANAEGVHNLRVAIRRLATCLREFPQFFPEKAAKKVCKRLRKLRQSAGDVRDRDIALHLTREAEISRVAPLPRQLARERKKATDKLRTMLDAWPRKSFPSGWRERLQLEDLAANHDGFPSAASNRDDSWNPQKSAENNASVFLPILLAEFFRSGRDVVHSEPQAKTLHQLRLEAKRLRYTLELFRPCYSPELNEWIERLKRLQDHLGSINDCRATQDLLARKAFKKMADADELRHYLDQVLRGETSEFVNHWREQFDSPGQEQAWAQFLRGAYAGPIAAD